MASRRESKGEKRRSGPWAPTRPRCVRRCDEMPERGRCPEGTMSGRRAVTGRMVPFDSLTALASRMGRRRESDSGRRVLVTHAWHGASGSKCLTERAFSAASLFAGVLSGPLKSTPVVETSSRRSAPSRGQLGSSGPLRLFAFLGGSVAAAARCQHSFPLRQLGKRGSRRFQVRRRSPRLLPTNGGGSGWTPRTLRAVALDSVVALRAE